MRFAIMETVVTPGGHEIDFDRLLVEELTALGHTVEFYVPEGHEFKWNYGVPVHRLSGKGISYQGAKGIKKLLLSFQRERNRQKWYKGMYVNACQHNFDAIIVPSATYRYLRGLKRSPLQHSPVPVLFLIHGATPEEALKLNQMAIYFKHEKNIRIGVQTFAPKKLRLTSPNIKVYGPPNYIPRDIDAEAERQKYDMDVLRLGFFGQYRKEKKIEVFLAAFLSCKFTRPVKLICQGATQTQEDADDFARIIEKYKGHDNIEFWNKPLIGDEWQRGLASVDTLVLPYGNDRYLYHTAALISNAMGYKKSIIAAHNVNPEILAHYFMGMGFLNGNMQALKQCIELFVNTYDENKEKYEQALAKAYDDFSPRRLAENIVALAEGDFGKPKKRGQ